MHFLHFHKILPLIPHQHQNYKHLTLGKLFLLINILLFLFHFYIFHQFDNMLLVNFYMILIFLLQIQALLLHLLVLNRMFLYLILLLTLFHHLRNDHIFLNFSILYHCNRLDPNEKVEFRKYSLWELEILRNYIVEEANVLAPVMKRDEKGNLIYEKDMKKEAKKQMQRLGDTFENLKGYYPDPKPLYTSDFFSQQYIMGYYFPFSLEANYNDRMCIINLPTTMCHELSHLKGFILEDEANFIGYLACMNSEDAFFRYSACLSVIYYLDNDFFAAAGEDAAYYLAQPVISEQVQSDKQFLTREAWEEVEEGAVLDTDFVEAASDAFTETTLTLNGVEDGKISYSRVVELMLRYYDGILY